MDLSFTLSVVTA
nr:RecName: Full=25 kDa structural polyprotein [Shrimp white spot syndrome virus]